MFRYTINMNWELIGRTTVDLLIGYGVKVRVEPVPMTNWVKVSVANADKHALRECANEAHATDHENGEDVELEPGHPCPTCGWLTPKAI